MTTPESAMSRTLHAQPQSGMVSAAAAMFWPRARCWRAALGHGAAALLACALLAGPERAVTADTAPIIIGMVTPLTGPAAESGRYAEWGAEMAVSEVNAAGGVMGRMLKLVIEDDQTTNPGVVSAFNRLANDPAIVAFLGSIRSTQVHAMDPDVRRVGKPVFFGGTDPNLTHAGDPWLFRCRPNDTYSAKVIAAFGVETLGLKKWALVTSTDAFGSSGARLLSAELQSLGASVVTAQGYANQTPDFTPVVLAVKGSGADVIGSYFTFEQDLAIFARQLRQLGVRSAWVGSPSITDTAALHLAGPALFGTYGVADFNADSSPEARRFADAYQKLHKIPVDQFAAWTYDAINLAALAIGNAKSTDPQGMRAAILAIRGYKGTEGVYDFDANGDGLHGYNVVQNKNGKIEFVKRVDFPAP
jgi:branched-chain amino acid transport system substrate-binding protein